MGGLAKVSQIDATEPALRYRFEASQAAVRQALDETGSTLGGIGVDDDLSATTQIVLAEVLNNVVEHAYGETNSGPILLTITLDESGLWCEVLDEGIAMPNEQLPSGAFPEIDLNDTASLPEGGFGWAMVLDMTKEVTYQRSDEINRLRFHIAYPGLPPS